MMTQWACRACRGPFQYRRSETPKFCPYCRGEDLEPRFGAEPRTIAELDAELRMLIDYARAAGEDDYVRRALRAREMAFGLGGESGRWFLEGYVKGASELLLDLIGAEPEGSG